MNEKDDPNGDFISPEEAKIRMVAQPLKAGEQISLADLIVLIESGKVQAYWPNRPDPKAEP